MSQLYIRVRTGFYANKKTARLRMAIGDDAFWVPPRIWAYAAENQPDGDLSGYTSEELSMLIGCVKHASSMLQALKDSGFVDPDGKIHDWDEHNSYHEKYAERAKKAAKARWSKGKKAPKSETGKEERGKRSKHCLSMLQALEAESHEFKALWEQWEQHRTEIRKKLTPTCMEKQLHQLTEMGISRALATLKSSISNGYTGLFEPSNRISEVEARREAALSARRGQPI